MLGEKIGETSGKITMQRVLPDARVSHGPPPSLQGKQSSLLRRIGATQRVSLYTPMKS